MSATVSNIRMKLTFNRLESIVGTHCAMHVCSFTSVLRCEICDEGFPVAVKDGDNKWAFCCITCVMGTLPDDIRVNIIAKPGSLDANHSDTSHDAEYSGGEAAFPSTSVNEYEEDSTWSDSETS